MITKVFAPLPGIVIPLEDVNDPVFAQKMLGDGIAISPSSGILTSPIDGEVTMVTDTLHAIGLKNDMGVELLIHIGIDTVSLNGEGFESFISVGQSVNVGTPLVEFDIELLNKKNIDPTIMIISTNSKEFNTSLKPLKNVPVKVTDVIWEIK